MGVFSNTVDDYSRVPPCKYTYLRECGCPGSALKTGWGTYYWCMRLCIDLIPTQQWTHNSSLCRGEQHVMIYEANASAVCLIWAGHLLADKWASQIQSVSELVKHKKVDPKRTNLSKAFLLAWGLRGRRHQVKKTFRESYVLLDAYIFTLYSYIRVPVHFSFEWILSPKGQNFNALSIFLINGI